MSDSRVPLVPTDTLPSGSSVVPLTTPVQHSEFDFEVERKLPKSPPSDCSPLADAHFIEGEEAYRRGDFERAVSEFTRCSLLQPHKAGVYLKRADAWKSLGRYDAAAADLTTLLQQNPTDERAAAGRGQLLSFLGRFREAVSDYSIALDRNPTNPTYYLSRGQSYSRLGDWPLAVADFAKSIDLSPGNAMAYLERGTALIHAEGDLNLASTDLSRAIQLNPFLGLAYARRAEVSEKLGKQDLATADLSEAIRLDPTNASLLALRGAALSTAGSAMAALDDFNAALRLEPNNPRLWGMLGRLHSRSGRGVEAEAAFTEAIRLDPIGVDWLLARGDERFSTSRYDDAMMDYTEAAHRQSECGAAQLGQAKVHLALTDFEMAARPLKRAIELSPNSADAYTQRSRWHSNYKRFDQALTDITRALELKPESIDARRLRADLCVRMGLSDAAYEDLAHLIRQSPKDPLIYLLRGKLEFRRQRYDSAARDLSMSLKLDSQNAEARAERALAYRALRKNWEALIDLVQAVQKDLKYSAEYMCQRGIVAGARKQYNRALADFSVAIHLDPGNRTAERGKEMVLQLQSAMEMSAVGSGQSLSHEVITAASELLGLPNLGVTKPQRVLKKQTAKRKAKKKSNASRKQSFTAKTESAASTIDTNPLKPAAIDLAEEDGVAFFTSKPAQSSTVNSATIQPSPDKPGVVAVNDHKNAAVTFNPNTKKFKLPTGPGTGLLKPGISANSQKVSEKQAGFFQRFFGQSRVAPKQTVGQIPNKKLNKQQQEELQKEKKAKLMHYGKIAIIPIGLLCVAYLLHDQFSGPDVSGVVAQAKAAGYPVSATVTSDVLWDQFAKDGEGCNKKYEEQYIEVSGKVSKLINTKQSMAIVLATPHPTFGIQCRLLQREDFEGVKEGDSIVIQGQSPYRQKADQNIVLSISKVRPK
jgi:tetratricopeptide (TPR) repeat protein